MAGSRLSRHISLARELGAESWAITGAEKFALRNAPQEIIISMDFPAKSTHCFSIKGIKKFNTLYLVDMPWSGDPDFQQYHSGWHYDETNETLYVKIRYRAKTERIRILYYEPELTDQPAGETANDDL